MKLHLALELIYFFHMHFVCNGLIKGTSQLTNYESYARCCPKNQNYDPKAPTDECTDFSAW